MVDPISNRRERFGAGSRHYIGDRELIVVRARHQKGRWVVAYDGVQNREAAEELRGSLLTGDPIDVLDEGEMWVHELVGSEVVDGAGLRHGTVTAVEVNPAHDLLVLDTGALIPIVFVSEFTPGPPGRVVVDVPDGLLDEEFVAANRAAVTRRPARRKGPR